MTDMPLLTEKEMLDFTVEQTRYGFRRSVVLAFEFGVAATADETSLLTIIEHALDDEWLVELSLNSGTTYREVVLSSYEVEDMADKKIGRVYRTTWTVKDMQTQPVAVLGGSW
jgi:hypothetical protein